MYWMKNCLSTSKFTEKNVIYYIQLWSHFDVLSHIMQQNLAAEIECISSLKFPTMQHFQMPTVINCLNIMLRYNKKSRDIFSVVTSNDEHRKPVFKIKSRS